MQSALVPQNVRHPSALQLYGEQSWVPLSAQLPAPSQVSARVNVEPLHDEAVQIVPEM
jgi:hypothetical protein